MLSSATTSVAKAVEYGAEVVFLQKKLCYVISFGVLFYDFQDTLADEEQLARSPSFLQKSLALLYCAILDIAGYFRHLFRAHSPKKLQVIKRGSYMV